MRIFRSVARGVISGGRVTRRRIAVFVTTRTPWNEPSCATWITEGLLPTFAVVRKRSSLWTLAVNINVGECRNLLALHFGRITISKTAVVYSKSPSSHCTACTSSKRWLSCRKVEYIVHDIEEDAEALEHALSYGLKEAPLIEVLEDGKVIDSFSGYMITKLEHHFPKNEGKQYGRRDNN